MASFNKATLLGHVGNDPEVRYTTSGEAVCNFSLATTERWRDKASGETREATEWHRIVCYRKLAEVAGQYVRKGTPLFLEGRIRTRKWTDKDGNDRYTTEIEMSEMQMLGNKQERTASHDGQPRPEKGRKPVKQKNPPLPQEEEDLPF